jgi:RNA polymerase sigma factor (sigma-70 family)
VNSLSDQQLLRLYTGRRSEAAFAELVRRHVDFVFSAAARMVGDAHLAQDVTQAAFLALAKNAHELADRPVLSGWLHRTARNLAAKTVRSEVRRRAREQEAAAMNDLLSADAGANWERIAPQLDAALDELADGDREALLPRYFERKSAREMAETLGVSDEAAQKRVSRAVERLRELFVKRGVSVGAGGLVAAVSAEAVQTAPIGLAAKVCAAAALIETVTTATITTHAIMNLMNAKAIAAVVAAAIAGGTGAYLVEQHEANALRHENHQLSAQVEQLTGERDAAVSSARAKGDELNDIKANSGELLKLRGEAGVLRRQTNEVAKLREENRQLRASAAAQKRDVASSDTDRSSDPQRQVAVAKINDARSLCLALLLYVDQNENRFPGSLDQASEYLTNSPSFTGTNQFELVLQGSITNVPNPATTLAVREVQPWQNADGKWLKAYGFADGHAEIKMEPEGGFAAWEQEHIIPPPAGQ